MRVRRSLPASREWRSRFEVEVDRDLRRVWNQERSVDAGVGGSGVGGETPASAERNGACWT